MTHPQQSGHAPLELLHERAVVRQPPPIEHLPDAFEEAGPVADIRPAHVQRFHECRWAAQDREFSEGSLHGGAGGRSGFLATMV